MLADLIENFEAGKVGGLHAWLVRLAGAADPDGKAPRDLPKFRERSLYNVGCTGGAPGPALTPWQP